MPIGFGSGNPLAVGESASDEKELRGNRGECAAGTADQREQPERRQAGRQNTGALGSHRSPVAVTYSPPERTSAGRSNYGSGTGGFGGDAHGADQCGTRA